MKKLPQKGFLVFFLFLTGVGIWGICQTFQRLGDVPISALLFGFFWVITAAGAERILWFLRGNFHLQQETEALRRKKELMEQVQEKSQKLAHHQRLQIIGTLTAAIAHEFNNLLTPIMGYSLLALEKLPPEEESLYDDILEIYNASRKAKHIISRLSDLSRKNTSSTFRIACPDELVHKTLDVTNPARPKKVEAVLDLNC